IVLASRDDEMLLRGHGTPEQLIALLAGLGADEIVLRDGAAGAYVRRGTQAVHIPPERVERVVDTTAAGDSFSGAYPAARLAGKAPEAAATLANRVAATTIQHPGALTPRDLRLLS